MRVTAVKPLHSLLADSYVRYGYCPNIISTKKIYTKIKTITRTLNADKETDY